MLYSISYVIGDVCEFKSLKEAEAEFPLGFLSGWVVTPLKVSTPAQLKRKLREGRANGTIR